MLQFAKANNESKTMNSRRYPRTMEEAFGPGHRGAIYEADPPMDRADRIVLIACALIAACLVVAWAVAA